MEELVPVKHAVVVVVPATAPPPRLLTAAAVWHVGPLARPSPQAPSQAFPCICLKKPNRSLLIPPHPHPHPLPEPWVPHPTHRMCTSWRSTWYLSFSLSLSSGFWNSKYSRAFSLPSPSRSDSLNATWRQQAQHAQQAG